MIMLLMIDPILMLARVKVLYYAMLCHALPCSAILWQASDAMPWYQLNGPSQSARLRQSQRYQHACIQLLGSSYQCIALVIVIMIISNSNNDSYN